MIVNVEQSSFSGVMLNVSRLVWIKEIIGSKMFGKSRFHNTFDDFRYQCKKTSQFKTQCKGDISHAFETAKITVFYPTLCKTPDAPLQNELLC